MQRIIFKYCKGIDWEEQITSAIKGVFKVEKHANKRAVDWCS
jgi:hypothetical protein